jgi:hypothetical protein
MTNIKNEKDVVLFKGFVFKQPPKKNKKVITLDLDETIGSFSHLHILWNGIMRFYNKNGLSENDKEQLFFQLFDLYPEFLRYDILHILTYLCKKQKENVVQLYLYTNNKCGYHWVDMIVKYLQYKISVSSIFNRTICAFKIGSRIVEPDRSTNNKTYSDLINCTKIGKNTQICFLDDAYHEEMIKDNIYYIQPKVYYHFLKISHILSRYFGSPLFTLFERKTSMNNDSYKAFLIDWFSFNNADKYILSYENYDLEREKEISRKILYYIKEFLYFVPRTKTSKKRSMMSNFTRKKKQ